MPVGSAPGLATRIAVVALLLSAAGAGRAAPAGDQHVTIDLYAFSQGDERGNPLKAEGFEYGAMRVDMKMRMTPAVAFRFNASVARLRNDDPQRVPASIENARMTAASAEILTLDSSIGLDIDPKDSPWHIRPSGYYHHQNDFVSSGGDLAVEREFAGGDTVLGVTYSFRIASPLLRRWSGRNDGRDISVANNLLLGWTQVLSPSWVLALSAQVTRQSGWLGESYNFVALFNDAGAPVKLVDEVLPRKRHRVQVNGRLRYTPRQGLVLGLDASGYLDDWSVAQLAVEPSLEVPLSRTIRWRFWYRLAWQGASRYFDSRPLAETRYRTQDPDLGSFLMHSPGTMLTLPFGEERIWLTRLGLYGFVRNDGIYGLGADLSLGMEW
ncbi:MAG: DUF3570 domain-containing protein [Deltaproteobacteria bacterium]|nr:DUF3570 domain-containing protein [Deltaproteobacteria bacterium]